MSVVGSAAVPLITVQPSSAVLTAEGSGEVEGDGGDSDDEGEESDDEGEEEGAQLDKEGAEFHDEGEAPDDGDGDEVVTVTGTVNILDACNGTN